MFEDIKVKISFEGTNNSHWHFTATLDGIDYTGHYDGGEIHWFQPAPKEHEVERMETEVHKHMKAYEYLESEMRGNEPPKT